MKSWKLHSGWAIVTVLAAAVSARVASRTETEPVRPTAPARSAPAPVVEMPAPLPVPAVVDVAETPAPAPAAPDEEKLRAQIRATEDFELIKKILQAIPQRALKLKMLREAACSQDVRSVYAALSVLEGMSGRDVAEVLEACLAAHLNKNRSYSAQVASMLGKLGDALSYEPLTQALQSTNEETRVNCADALKKLGYPAAAQELVIAYTRQFESPDGSLRKKSVETLAHLNLEGSIAVFVRALKDSNGDVRLEALNAFSSLDKKEYLPLLEPLVNDLHPEVAEEAKDLVEGLKSQDK